MKVRLAKTAGFCMGVRRALDLVLKTAGHCEKPVYTFGPLIHNPQVLEILKKRGVLPVDSLESIQGGTVFIRAHGVPPHLKEDISERCTQTIDATCPHVVRAQVILDRYARKGYTGVIVGDRDHPEVIGLMGFTHGKGVVVGKKEDLHALPPSEKLVIVAQTTQNLSAFEDIAAHAQTYFQDVRIERTICGATRERQAEVVAMAPHVDAMVVVGGHNSGNTRRLAHISRESGVKTFHVETDEELDPSALSSVNVVGVTAGASTPTWMIKRVTQKIESLRGREESIWSSIRRRLLKYMLQSNLYVALGGAAITYASMSSQNLVPSPITATVMAIAFLFLYSVHVLNHFMDREAGQFNDSERTRFILRNRTWFLGSGVCAQPVALFLALRLGTAPFAATLVVMILGLLYSVRLTPASLRDRIPYSRIKELPGSKPISIALGWGVVTTVIPALAAGLPDLGRTAAAFVVVVVLVFVRSAFFEVLDVQGDMIVGKETLPILLGERRTLGMLNGTVLGLAVFLALYAFTGMGTRWFLIFEICCLYALGYLWLYRRQNAAPGPGLEIFVESNFLVAGLAAYLSPAGFWG